MNNLFIIDAHIHLGHTANFYIPDVSPERAISMMDKCKIKSACMSHILGLVTHNFEYAHKETLKLIQQYPGRIYGYAIYNPNFPEKSLESVKRYLAIDGFIGVKAHAAMHRYPIDGKDYEPLWEFAKYEDVPILIHTWDAFPLNTYPFDHAQIYAQPKLLDSVAMRYPQLRMIIAHCGGQYNGHLQAIEIAHKYENVYVDISGVSIGFGLLEWFVKEIGGHKILFGTDMNWIDPRVHIGRVLGAKIKLRDKERIFYENANSVFNFRS
jgi:predicted TIM-barrel fold metal-dependent hydrolase